MVIASGIHSFSFSSLRSRLGIYLSFFILDVIAIFNCYIYIMTIFYRVPIFHDVLNYTTIAEVRGRHARRFYFLDFLHN